ncbi:MAG TPA: hypothetical protein VHG90_02225 [Acidimicrobiales bacterium]|nr:hypothetical protein [Acidimicrobiales bacterium]
MSRVPSADELSEVAEQQGFSLDLEGWDVALELRCSGRAEAADG